MARPKKPARLRKEERIPLQVSKDQKRIITEAAQLDDKETAVWAREHLLIIAQERIAATRKNST